MMSFLDPVLLSINAAPGVKSAATVTTLPLELTPQWEFEVDGRADFPIDSLIHAVSPLYLETMGIRLNGGRHFTDRDTAASQRVLIVNQAFIRKAFPNRGTAIGQRVHLVKEAASMFHETPREIVGVVADVRKDTDGLRNDPTPAAYIPQAQSSDAFSQVINHFVPISLVVKTQGSPAQAAQSVKQIVRSVDPLQPMVDIRVMEEIVDRATIRDRFNLTLMGIFALVALVLASVGIYGVVSYAVSQRTQELGVRIALGASFTDVLGLVIGRGMVTALAGVAAGVVGAYALSRFLAGLLFSIKAADPLTFALVTVLILTVAFVANLVPARRATRVDPIRALRYE
jgi:predicted permease